MCTIMCVSFFFVASLSGRVPCGLVNYDHWIGSALDALSSSH